MNLNEKLLVASLQPANSSGYARADELLSQIQRAEARVGQAARALYVARGYARQAFHPDPEVRAFYAGEAWEQSSRASDELRVALGWLDDLAAELAGAVVAASEERAQ